MTPYTDARLHCVEAMPSTFAKLHHASQTLGWQDTFVVHHAAALDQNGVILFPDQPQLPGYESMGLEDCAVSPQLCQNVTVTTLDAFYVEKVLPLQQQKQQPNFADNSVVDYLSIDVEGFDWAVLRGGKGALTKTRYVEFEVHNKGLWKEVTLETAILSLRAQNFWCYYLGTAGRLWRLTDCMTGPGKQVWSNVGCVNVPLAPHLAQRMEEVFLHTIGNS